VILKTGVKLQLIVFAIITVLGVTIISVNYIGVGRELLGREYTAYVDLTDSGGVFTGAEVTYRGVPVGRVGPIQLTRDGIRVRLDLERGKRIPREGTTAVVANRSAVGEQYIDLQPARNNGPYLDEGEPYTIPRNMTKLPVSTAELLRNVDKLVGSVNPQHVGTLVDELDKAFSGSASDLQAILDDTDRLLKTAEKAYPDTKQLLDNGAVVLDTQRSQGANIAGFARNLNELTTQLRRDDPALRRSISLFILYPLTVGGAFTVTPGDGTQHLGLALNISSPPNCTKGYEGVEQRDPRYTDHKKPRLDAGCKDAPDSGSAVRGSRNYPRDAVQPPPAVPPGATDGAGFPAGGAYGDGSNGSGDQAKDGEGAQQQPLLQTNNTVYVPLSSQTVEIAGYDPATGVVYGPDGKQYGLGYTGGQQRLLGDASWKMLLLGPLAR
jgi:virulence factor Mce-like protein